MNKFPWVDRESLIEGVPLSGIVGTKILCTVSNLRMGLVAFPAMKPLEFDRDLSV